jgi:hypothetical protein
MKKTLFIVLSLLVVILLSFIIGCKKVDKQPEAPKQDVVQSTQENIGEKLFNEHCVMCHPDNKKMKDINKTEDIIKTMWTFLEKVDTELSYTKSLFILQRALVP